MAVQTNGRTEVLSGQNMSCASRSAAATVV